LSSDDDFPYLDETEYIQFPDPLDYPGDLPVCSGGNLSPGVVLSAYLQGLFPWPECEDELLWWSPDPRCVIKPEQIHVSNSMKKILNRGHFSFSIDNHFETVIKKAASIERRGQPGTWITDGIIDSYIELHKLGYAHSFEVYDNEGLAGGLYGLSLGSVFFGESMFSIRPNSSKAAFIFLCKIAGDRGLDFVDCQMPTNHLLSLGASVVSRADYMEMLQSSLSDVTFRGSWKSFAEVES
jgi:leucyl/phenylalanyl-tRNA--protein transferase